MEITGLIPHIEALIFASEKPLSVLEVTDLLNNAFGFMEDKISLDQVEAAMEGVVEKYNSEFYPFEVVQSGGGWQFLTKKDYHKTVAQLNGDKFMKRLSAAALETLAIIAYKQPVTKGEIEAIRGVSADYAVQKLLEKDLVIISGRNEKLPGHPLVYATSKSFMDYFGINSSDDLPKIKEVLAEQLVEPTPASEMNEEVETNAKNSEEQEEDMENIPLAVTELGELIENKIEEREESREEIGESQVGESIPAGEAEQEAETENEPSGGIEEIDAEEIMDEKKQVHEENPGGETEEENTDSDNKEEEDKEPEY